MAKKPLQPVQFVCLRCHSKNVEGLPLVRGRSDDEFLQCEVCGTGYRIKVCRLTEDSVEAKIDSVRSRYNISYVDSDNSIQSLRFQAQSGLFYEAKHTLVLAYHRGRLVEIADQATQEWRRIFLAKTRASGPLLIGLGLVLSYLGYLFVQIVQDMQMPKNPLDWAIIGLLGIVFAIGATSWLFRPVRS